MFGREAGFTQEEFDRRFTDPCIEPHRHEPVVGSDADIDPAELLLDESLWSGGLDEPGHYIGETRSPERGAYR